MREGFQDYLEICMADDGFVGRYEVVEPRRGNRRWPNDGIRCERPTGMGVTPILNLD